MAFKQVYSSLFAVIACCSVLSMANPLSYLRDNDQSGYPFQNQGFVYLRDNNVSPYQTAPVNYLNNIVASPQVQTITSIPNTINNVGLVQYPNAIYGSNIVSNVNSISTVNGLSTVQYPTTIAQTVPVTQVVSNPGLIQPIGQYAVQQQAFIGGSVGYPNQVTNNQLAPVEVNIGPSSGPGYVC